MKPNEVVSAPIEGPAAVRNYKPLMSKLKALYGRKMLMNSEAVLH